MAAGADRGAGPDRLLQAAARVHDLIAESLDRAGQVSARNARRSARVLQARPGVAGARPAAAERYAVALTASRFARARRTRSGIATTASSTMARDASWA